MPSQTVDLTAQQADFVRETISRGLFQNANAVIEAGLKLLQEQQVEVDVTDSELAETLPILRKSLAQADAGMSRSVHDVVRDLANRHGIEIKQ